MADATTVSGWVSSSASSRSASSRSASSRSSESSTSPESPAITIASGSILVVFVGGVGAVGGLGPVVADRLVLIAINRLPDSSESVIVAWTSRASASLFMGPSFSGRRGGAGLVDAMASDVTLAAKPLFHYLGEPG